MEFLIPVLIGLAVGIVIAFIAWIISSRIGFNKGVEHRKQIAEAELGGAEQEAERIVKESLKAAEAKKREALIEAKEEIHKSKIELEKEIKDRRTEIQHYEKRVLQKEDTLDKKIEGLEQKE